MRDEFEQRLAKLNEAIQELQSDLDQDQDYHFGSTMKKVKLSDMISQRDGLLESVKFLLRNELLG